MRTIKYANAFKKDYKQVKVTPRHTQDVERLLNDVLRQLLEDSPLPTVYRDHALSGAWSGYRECHVTPDSLLIYMAADSGILHLARLGSHSELIG